MEEKQGRYRTAKSFYVRIKKECQFDMVETLRFFDVFLKQIKAEKIVIYLDRVIWRKGYMKIETLLRYRKGIENFIAEHSETKFDYTSINCQAKIDGKLVSLSFSTVYDHNYTLLGHSLTFYDYGLALDPQLDEELLSNLTKFVDAQYIEKTEISNYKKDL